MESAQEFIQRKEEQYRKGRKVLAKDIGRKGKHVFTIEAWCFMPQSNYGEKVFVIERLRREGIIGETVLNHVKPTDVEYRIGYYVIGRIGNKTGRWTWGQYCPFIPVGDFEKLIELAREKGVINDQ